MSGVMVLVEHRRGEIREITWEMLAKAQELSSSLAHRKGPLGDGPRAAALLPQGAGGRGRGA